MKGTATEPVQPGTANRRGRSRAGFTRATPTAPVQPGNFTGTAPESGCVAELTRLFGIKPGSACHLLKDGKIRGCVLQVRVQKSGVRLFDLQSIRALIAAQMGMVRARRARRLEAKHREAACECPGSLEGALARLKSQVWATGEPASVAAEQVSGVADGFVRYMTGHVNLCFQALRELHGLQRERMAASGVPAKAPGLASFGNSPPPPPDAQAALTHPLPASTP